MTALTVNPTRRPPDTYPDLQVRPEELRGRSIGVFVCAGFGLLWATSALSGISSSASAPVLAVSIAVFVALVLGGIGVRHAAGALPPSQPGAADQTTRRVGRRLALVVSVEWAAIAAAVVIITATAHSHLIPAVICAAVGLHFVPLGRLFSLPLYNATAAGLCLVAVATLIAIPTTGSAQSLWQILPGFGAAITLWATGTVLTAQSLALVTRPVRPAR